MARTSSSTELKAASSRIQLDESDIDALAVQIAIEVKQNDFKKNDAAVEHRPPAKIRYTIVTAFAKPNPHRINAVAQPARGIES